MATATQYLAARPQAPPLILELPERAWASAWGDKAPEGSPIGLRVPSEADLVEVRAEAVRKSLEFHPDEDDIDGRNETHNSFLMSGAVARAVCLAEDLTQPYWETPEVVIREAFTSGTIEWLFWQLTRLMVTQSPAMPEATDEEIAVLAKALMTGQAWTNVNGAASHRARRMLRHVLDELRLAASG